jgi:hypothetical protein
MRALSVTVRPSGALHYCLNKLHRFLPGFVTAAALSAALSFPASAQQPQIINHGQIAVTGYSGSVPVAPPAGADPFDYLTIRTDGPSMRIADVRVLGPQGQLSDAPETFTVTAAQTGQLFGVAIDNAPQPNIYVAATSAYGLAISVLDPNGQAKRVRKGEPGAQWMAGQFGPPAVGGGPGSIWRIDGITGQVALFANIEVASFGAAALGGLAYDPVTQQLFAVDRSSGLIHRFSLDGVQRGTYDHGTEGRGPAGLPPIPSPGVVPVNIGSPAFDTENPSTWGAAQPARRVFALAVRNSRLYYSVAQGPQVWSVGISPSGAVSASPRIEVEVPSLQDGVEIASIAFDSQGQMYLAERAATTGDYFRYTLANGGASRVLRYVPKLPGDPSPGLWRLTPDIYSIGLPPVHANANGGIAIGWGYRPDNVIDFNACRATVWSTGERLLDPGDPATPPDTYPHVDGLQANALGLIQPQNTPPLQSYFIDYDDLNGDTNYRGHMGAVAIMPCPGQPAVAPPPPPPPPPPVTCPPGTYYQNGKCIIFPTCPPGTNYQNGQCVYDTCPPGMYFQNGQCVPPPVSCPPGTFYYQGQCFPIDCPPGLVELPNGQCVCPPGFIYYQGQCVPPQNCPPGMVELPGGICWCPLGTIFGDGFCKPSDCPPDHIIENGFCKPCGPGMEEKDNKCVPDCKNNEELFKGECLPKCPPLTFRQPDGSCKPLDLTLCPPPKEMVNGVCKDPCPPLTFRQPDGTCKPLDLTLCPAPKEMVNGVCKDPCPPLTFRQPDGTCKPLDLTLCPAPKEMVNGVCKDPCPPLTFRQPDGTCKPLDLTLCLAPKEMVNGVCKDPCPIGTFRQADGTCKGMIFCLAPQVLVNGECKDPCPAGHIRLPNGTCKKLDIVVPPVIQPLPPIIDPLPPPPDPLPPVVDPGIVLPPGGIKIPPVIVTPPPGPKPEQPPKVNPGIVLPPGGIKLPPVIVTPPPEPKPEQPPKVNPGIVLPPGGLKLPGVTITPPPADSSPPANPPKVNPGLTIAPGTLKVAPTIKTAPAEQKPKEETPPADQPPATLVVPPMILQMPAR